MDARDARPMHLNPLLSESCVVNVSYVWVNADERAVDIIQEGPELSGRQQKALFRVAILAADSNFCSCRDRRKLLHRVQAALINLMVGNFLGHKPCCDKYGVATKKLGGLHLALDDANRFSADLRVAGRQRGLP